MIEGHEQMTDENEKEYTSSQMLNAKHYLERYKLDRRHSLERLTSDVSDVLDIPLEEANTLLLKLGLSRNDNE